MQNLNAVLRAPGEEMCSIGDGTSDLGQRGMRGPIRPHQPVTAELAHHEAAPTHTPQT